MLKYERGNLRSHVSSLEIIFQAFDIVWVVGCLLFASWLNRFPWNPHFSFLAVFAVLFFHSLARQNGLYRSWRVTSLGKEIREVIFSWGFVVLLVLLVAFLTKLSGEYSRRVFITWFVSAQISLILWRIGLRSCLRALRKRGKNTRTVAIAGAGRLGLSLARIMENASWMGFVIEAFYDDFKPTGASPISGV